MSPPCVRGEQVHSWQSHGVALTTCELGNGTWSVPFQGSRADAKQMRGKRSSAVSTARDGAERSEAGGLLSSMPQRREPPILLPVLLQFSVILSTTSAHPFSAMNAAIAAKSASPAAAV